LVRLVGGRAIDLFYHLEEPRDAEGEEKNGVNRNHDVATCSLGTGRELKAQEL
jgi:hypothetical protein